MRLNRISQTILIIILASVLAVAAPVTAQNPLNAGMGRLGRLQFEIGLTDEEGYALVLDTEAKVGENMTIRFIFWPEVDMHIHSLTVDLGGAIPKTSTNTLMANTDAKAWTEIRKILTVKPNQEGWISYTLNVNYTYVYGSINCYIINDIIYARNASYPEVKAERDALELSNQLLSQTLNKTVEESQRIINTWMITAGVFIVTTIILVVRTVIAKRKITR
jgi:hypothetical protein